MSKVNLAIPTTASNAPAVATGEKSCPSFKKRFAIDLAGFNFKINIFACVVYKHN